MEGSTSTSEPRSRAPSPFAMPASGHAFPFWLDPLGFLQAASKRCGPIARLRIGTLVYHLVSDPSLVADVLHARAANYIRDTRSSRNVRLVTGESLLSTTGEAWRRQRRLAQPVFHQRRLAALAQTMVDACNDTAAHWHAAATDGRTLDLASEMSRLTFSIVGRCLFGSELGSRAGEVEKAFPTLLAELFRRAKAIASLPIWMPTPRHVRFKRALATIDGIVSDILRARRAAQAERDDDLLGLLLQARDEDGSTLSDEEIRNHIITFLLAGHETTASTLTWTLCLLDQHPDARATVERELDQILGDRALTPETLAPLQQLNASLLESLRLYPTIWIAERRVVADDVLGGFAIPAGSSVIVSAFVTQRLEQHFPEPDTFRPARFLDPDSIPGIEQGYFPFGAGPHQCIGQHFALFEAKIALATLLSRFRVRLTEKFPVPLPGITLRTEGAVPVRIETRPQPGGG